MSRAVLVYDGACSLCSDWAATVERRAGGRVRTRAAQGLSQVRLEEPGGRVTEGFDVLKRLSALVPAFYVFWPLLRLPGAGWAGPKLYAAFARWRFALSETLSGR